MSLIERSIDWNSFKELPVSLGRNGSINTSGVVIYALAKNSAGPGFVNIRPLTKDGKVGNCIVAVPSDPNTLKMLAFILREVATELQEQRCKEEKETPAI